ncbi:hypothetical protein [Geobacter anodireducens]|uniref:Uncharacterized protein n=1 Tax=Geobacter soli TaxID=1510391 RepID=A0A0C1U754_9BACT|nr:hypothetical protein [Geobacter soli]KIE43485.1 hypothetical protein SE37_13020 [Geobacter soli]
MSISSEINQIDIKWWELFDTIRGLRTEVQNRIVIEREVIPIIFIPGIMGSRLKFAKGKKQGTRAWDPDSSGFMSVVALEPFSGTGDGTVPDSSGKALKVPTARIGRDSHADFFSIDHQRIYGADPAKKIVFTTVWNLAIKRIEEKAGAARA